jgi:hypothetical protein
MTNRLAIILGILIAAGITLDVVLQEGAASLFLARKFFVLLDYLAFWR